MRFSQSFGAGQMIPFNVPGNFFRIKRLSGFTAESISVRFFRSHSELPIDLTFSDAGDKARSWPDGFDRVEVTSTVAQTVAFQINRGDVDSERVQGEVSVIDGGAVRALNNEAFWGYHALAGLAANNAHVQLWNPAGSGKNVFVDEVAIIVQAAGAVHVRTHNAALTDGIINSQSKRIGGAVSASEMRTQQNVGMLGVSWIIHQFPAAMVNTEFVRHFFHPILIPPGLGLVWVPLTVNVQIDVHVQFFEKLV